MSQAVRTTREYFVADSDLKRALELAPSTIILRVERKTGIYKGRGRDDQRVDLEGCLITVFDPQESANGR